MANKTTGRLAENRLGASSLQGTDKKRAPTATTAKAIGKLPPSNLTHVIFRSD